jgi:DNA-binding response OmpR family regulator
MRRRNDAAHQPHSPRVLIVDHDGTEARLLQEVLRYRGFDSTVALSAREGLEVIRRHVPDLLLLDRDVADLDALEALRRVRAHHPHLPVVVFSEAGPPADEVLALESGADDYVRRPLVPDVLAARLRAVLRRQLPERGRSVLRFADLHLDVDGHVAYRGEREIALTHLEFQLLREFLARPGRVLSKAFLLENVWGFRAPEDANIVEVYIKQLRRKLEAAGEPRLIHTIRGAGYVMRSR